MGILTTLLSGGLTGLFGTAISGFFKLWEAKQARAHELQLREQDMLMMDKEAEVAERIAEIEAEKAAAQSEAESIQQSYRSEQTRLSAKDTEYENLMVFVDVVRGLMRPGLTVAFVIITACIYFVGLDVLSESEILTVRVQIVYTVLYLTEVTVTWWFGSRQIEKSFKAK